MPTECSRHESSAVEYTTGALATVCGHVFQFTRVKAMDTVHLIDRTDGANVLAADHQHALIHGAAAVPARGSRWFHTNDLTDRHADE